MTSNASSYLIRKRHLMIDKIIRVNHAGEMGADRIYLGQIMALRRNYPEKAVIIQEMWNQEKKHLEEFEFRILKHRASKSMLLPFLSLGAFGLGYIPALFGPKTAMAVTVAVEKVIVAHYDNQLRVLMADDSNHKELIEIIKKYRDDEQRHHDTGIENEAEISNCYKLVSSLVSNITKLAIKVAEKI